MSPRRRVRLDQLLVDRGHAGSLAAARALIMAGEVSLPGTHGRPTAGLLVAPGREVVVRERPRFVSRGGEKLEHALDHFGVDPSGMTFLDVGASTGGFSDCLLQRGAALGYAVDTGRGQLHSRLRDDARLVSMEGVNARDPFELPGPVDLVVADVAFISLTAVLPVALRHLVLGGRAVVLLKPQFEARRQEVPRGGVIRDPVLRGRVIGRFVRWLTANAIRLRGLVRSPVTGDAGNVEYLLWLEPAGPPRGLGGTRESPAGVP